MRQIEPVNVWINGQQKQANQLSMYIINDNLTDSVTFYYALLTVSGEKQTSTQVAQGNLTMSGTEYETWGDSGNINDEAYVWAAAQLNLTLV